MEEFLKIINISKSFGKLKALHDVSFEVNEGEILGIIGPNGAGKTTLFNVLSGFYKPDTGKIMFLNKDIIGMPANKIVRMGLCRTFQIPKPFRDLTVFDNVKVCTLFNDRIKTLNMPLEKYLEQLLNGIGLEEYALLNADSLGYGNLKRLEFGRAEATIPKVLLLDEPFAGLNSDEIQSIANIFLNLKKAKVLTVLIVEHKLRELMKLVDRVVVLNYGVKLAEGSPDFIQRDEKVIQSYLGKRWKIYDSRD